MNAPHPASTLPGLTLDQLGELWQIPAKTIRAHVIDGEWPCHRFGKHIRFLDDDIAEIRAISKNAAITTTPQPGAAKLASAVARLQRTKRTA